MRATLGAEGLGMSLEFNNYLYKRYFRPKGKIMAMNELDNPGFAMITKKTNSGGEDFSTPANISGGRGWAKTRIQAQGISDTAAGNGSFGRWENKQGEYAGNLRYAKREIQRSESSDTEFAAFERSQRARTDGFLSSFGGIMSRIVWGPPGGYLFQGASLSSGVITLNSNDSERVAHVEVGDQLQNSDNDGSSDAHTLNGSGSIGYVIAVGRTGSTPTVTVSPSDGGSAGNPAGWSGTGYFYRVGEFKGARDSGVDAGHVMDSYQSWVPAAEDTSLVTAFKNVLRGKDGRLSGARRTANDVSQETMEEALEGLNTFGRSRYGWKGKRCFLVHDTRFQQLSRGLESRRFRGSMSEHTVNGDKAYAAFSYNKISLHTQSGSVEVIPDPHIPQNEAYCLRPQDWEFRAIGGFPGRVDQDGINVLRKATSDDFEIRMDANGSFMLAADGLINQNGRTALPDAS